MEIACFSLPLFPSVVGGNQKVQLVAVHGESMGHGALASLTRPPSVWSR